MKNILIIIFFFTLFSCKKRNKEGWIVFLKEKIENTNWETGYPNEKLIFKNDTLKFYKNDSIINYIDYKLEGKSPTGLMGYGSLFYLKTKKNKLTLKFWDDYKLLAISKYNSINFLIYKNEKEIDSIILNGFIRKGVSNKMSIKQIDSLLSPNK